jgi:hypothetical protein
MGRASWLLRCLDITTRALGGVILLGACQDPMPSTRFPALSVETLEERAPRVAELRLGSVDFVGTAEAEPGTPHFGRAHAASAMPSGIVVVSDPLHCRVTVLGLREEGFDPEFSTFGACGEGPNEFNLPTTIGAYGDSLLVWEDRRRELSFVDMDGAVGRKLRLEAPLSFAAIGPIAGISDSTLVVGFMNMNRSAAEEHHLLAIVDARSGRVMSEHLAFPPISAASPRGVVLPALCVRPSAGTDRRVVVLNRWTAQVLIYDASDAGLALLSSTWIDIPWRHPQAGEEEGSGWRPPGPVPYVACGPEAIIMHHGELAWEDGAREDQYHLGRARIDMLDYYGRWLGTLDQEHPYIDPRLLLWPQTMVGDRVVGVSNSFFPHPVVGSYRIEIPSTENGP